MLIIAVPHFDAEWQVGGDVVEVGIGQLSQQCVDAKIGFRRSAPEAFAFSAELLQEAKRIERAIILCVFSDGNE